MSKRTEDVNPRFSDIENWSILNGVEAMYEGQLSALAAVRPALPAISQAVESMAERIGDKGRLIYVGAGTSGRLAVLDGVELRPTFGWPDERLAYCLAGGEKALIKSAEGAEDNREDAVAQIDALKVTPRDIVIGVAASGRTPFAISAINHARQLGALTLTIANNAGSALLEAAEHPILVESGSEVVAGSTRMKAGTTQKVVLNLLSTALMLRLGHVYKGYMVDMIVSNEKLQNRAISMVSEIADVAPSAAKNALSISANNIKEAILIALGDTHADAKKTLDDVDRNLSSALKLRAERV